MAKDLLLKYDRPNKRMLVHVPHAISDFALKRVTEMARKIDHARYLAENPGDKKDIFKEKVEAYDAGRVQQVVTNVKGDAYLFKSTERTGQRIISLGAST